MLQRSKQSTSGYARIAQAEEDEEDEYHDDPNDEAQRTISGPGGDGFAPLQPGRRPLMEEYKVTYTTPSQKRRRRNRSSSAVDVKAINARLEKWADEIAQKFKLKKIKGKSHDEEKLEIHHSVFVPPDDITPASAETLTARFTEQPDDRMTKMQYDDVVESVKVAIELGMHPKMITQGSSGSYFARNSQGKTVGVFKPKDEEPYATRNPKWTKWIHRNLFPFAFGRACLIPNLSYVSEAAAYLLDTRLQTNIVPYTDIVYLSSISFNNDYWDRRAYYRKKKQLPPKVGSFQVFLKGFQDANIFLKKHPWPDQQTSTLRAPSSAKGKRKKRWVDNCRPGRADTEDEDEESSMPGASESQKRKVFWSDALQLSFREQLEKLVILDYIMRNTDRGLDNWMVRIDEASQTAFLVASPPKLAKDADFDSQPTERDETMNSGYTTPEPDPTVSLGAIDNSLSWPWKHPDAWRSFPFGWLFLPVSLIGQPFTATTRSHFLPLLTSKQWWSDTQIALRKCFEQDSDFKERMFARQIAVMKGQAWNVVETLKTEGHGPLELTRRARVCVWDDLVEVPIVFPLRESSEDMRRQAAAPQPDSLSRRKTSDSDDGSDIAGAYTTTHPTSATKSGLPISPDSEIPSSKRFNLSRQSSPEAIALEQSSPATSNTSTNTKTNTNANTNVPTQGSKAAQHLVITLQSARGLSQIAKGTSRPGAPRSKTRLSYEGARPAQSEVKQAKRKRNMSFSARRLSVDDDFGGGGGGRYGEDGRHGDVEDDGDLGFAAASLSDHRAMRRKVIVERLETVKSKGPVFTWC